MAEGREYISRAEDLGTVHISGEVMAVIAAAAALEVEGVSALTPHLGGDLSELSGKKILSKGVRLRMTENVLTVDISILVKYGYVVPDVARQVQQAVQSAVAGTSGLSVGGVNVLVAGVTFPKEKR